MFSWSPQYKYIYILFHSFIHHLTVSPVIQDVLNWLKMCLYLWNVTYNNSLMQWVSYLFEFAQTNTHTNTPLPSRQCIIHNLPLWYFLIWTLNLSKNCKYLLLLLKRLHNVLYGYIGFFIYLSSLAVQHWFAELSPPPSLSLSLSGRFFPQKVYTCTCISEKSICAKDSKHVTFRQSIMTISETKESEVSAYNIHTIST